MWLAQTLSVLSRLITTLINLFSLSCNNRKSPVPRSFHSLESVTNRNNLARILKMTSSFSSLVVTLTFSVNWITGS